MKILGIHDGHDCSAALMKDGVVLAAAQEERFTGLKTDYGYPKNAIEYCLKSQNITPDALDKIVLVSKRFVPYKIYLKMHANFSVKDEIKAQTDYWYPTLYEKKKISFYSLFKDSKQFNTEKHYDYAGLLEGHDPEIVEKFRTIRIKKIAEYLKVSSDKIENIDHENGHIYYALFGSPFRNEKVNIVTCEGFGDYSCSTVSIYHPNENRIEMLDHNTSNQLGWLYQHMTLLLGMKPGQHEYKVMGLAPYGHDRGKCCEIFKEYFKVEGLNIVRNPKLKDLFFQLKERLLGYRFDDIAAGLQKALEELLSSWFENIYKKTGVKNFVFAGGVAQNIKACKSLHEKEFVEKLNVCPAAGDTSLSVGGCYYACHKYSEKKVTPIKNIYLGPSCDNAQEIEDALKKYDIKNKYHILRNVTNEDIAKFLSEGKIIARSKGRMEFGLRALGNRSILANPGKYSLVKKINAQIKFRDFWMPFTPSILDYRAKDYIVNPKNLDATFMTVAFDSTELAKRDLSGAIHPMDDTVRPQVVREDVNADYYDLIKKFEGITGIGGVLNTSFNLHGEPIVINAERALHTFINSNLDMVQIDDVVVSREKI